MSKDDKHTIEKLERRNKELEEGMRSIVAWELAKNGLAMYRNTGAGSIAFKLVGDSDE